MLRVGDEFDKGRYTVASQLGKGTFGRVVEMVDKVDKRPVAVKVVRAVDKYAREAEIESEIIRALQRTLPADGSFPIVWLHRTFESRGHYCLAFDKMGPSLYSVLNKLTETNASNAPGGGRAGAGSYFSLGQIACVASNCFRALAHMHSIHLTHTDLKPENVLFVHPLERGAALPTSPEVALIDFGGATWSHEHHSSVVCTRQYRPPEVTLGLEWSHPIDVWSMGCILAELWTGSLLFSTHDEVEHLALMERALGALPRKMIRSATCKRADRNFRHGYLRWPERAIDRASEEHVRSQRRLKERLTCDARGEPLRLTPELGEFHDLLLKLLEFVPEHRLTAAAAMQSPFVLRAHFASKKGGRQDAAGTSGDSSGCNGGDGGGEGHTGAPPPPPEASAGHAGTGTSTGAH